MVTNKCPVCGLDDLHHSRFRSFGEKLRFNFTRKELFRCHSCGWRGWLHDVPESAAPLTDVHEPLNEEPASLIGDLMSDDNEEREHKKRRA